MTLLIVAIIIIAAGYFLLRIKKTTPVDNTANPPAAYAAILNREVAFYQGLDDDNKAKFEKMVGELLQYVRIEGVGTEITDVDRALIASSAVIPVFGFPGWKYKNLTNVILYPDTFDDDFQFEGESRNIMGMVGKYGHT
jgi:Mlc titration factor MtfA (ptsG expression regulator)